MDMCPENGKYHTQQVHMEPLSHFSSIFTEDDCLFLCNLKSAYFSVLVDICVGCTMGFKWGNKWFKFTCLPFGWKMAPYAFIKIGRQILKKWHAVGPSEWESQFKDVPELAGGARSMLYIDDGATGALVLQCGCRMQWSGNWRIPASQCLPRASYCHVGLFSFLV